MTEPEKRITSIQLRPTLKVLHSIVALQADPDFKTFSDWIQESFLTISVTVALDLVLSDKQHNIAQGKAIALSELKDIIKSANSYLTKVKDAKTEI